MSHDRSTRLSLFCEHVIEGCWLAALVVTPVFFNVYSNRIFDPDKTAVLRSLGLLIGLAWIVRNMERWAASRDDPADHSEAGTPTAAARSVKRWLFTLPVVSLALALFIDLALSTSLSVSPRISFWGSYPRLQGLYTNATYIGIFLSIVALLRTREQLDRLVTTAIVVSLPVALYGIIQSFGTDPLQWGGDVTQRVSSSLGNPLFAAAFLILIVPPTLYRLFDSGVVAAKGERIGTRRVLVAGGLVSLAFQMASWWEGPAAGTASAVITVGMWLVLAVILRKPLVALLRISIYTVLLSAQLMCLLFSQSRGPWLALGAGLFLFALFRALIKRRRKRALFIMGCSLTVALLLVAINVPGSPLRFAKEIPYAGRLVRLSDVDRGSTRVRLLIWQGMDRLITDDPLRSIVGYGPETLYLVYPPFLPPRLIHMQGNRALPDRAHNETFDRLATTGLVGLAIYLLFITSLFYLGLKWSGLVRTRDHRKVFLLLWFAGGGAAVLLVRFLDDSWRFVGLSLPVGLLLGLMTYLFWYALPPRSVGLVESRIQSLRLLAAALLAALVAHFAEIQLGLAIVATRTYFWTYAAALVAGGFFLRVRVDPLALSVRQYQPVPGMAAAPPIVHPAFAVRTSTTGSPASEGLIVGFVLVTLIYDFVVPVANLGWSLSFVWMLVFTWGFGGLVVVTETWPAGRSMSDPRPWLRRGLIYGAISGLAALVFLMIHGSVLRAAADLSVAPLDYFGACAVVAICLGYLLDSRDVRPERWCAQRISPGYVVLTAALLWVAYTSNIRLVRADVYYKRAYQLRAQGRYDEAVKLHRRAIALEPRQDVSYLSFGKTLMEQAERSSDPTDLLEETERVLVKARELSPRNTDHTANLARLFQAWGRRTQDARLRDERLGRSLALFEEAVTMSPNEPELWNGKGTTYLLLGDTTQALQMYRRSLALDDGYYETHMLLGNLHFARKDWKKAANAYETVLRLEPGLIEARLSLALTRKLKERQREPAELQ